MWREKKKKLTKFWGFFAYKLQAQSANWRTAVVRVGEDPGNEVIILALVLARLIIAAWFPAVKMAAQRGKFVFCSNCC